MASSSDDEDALLIVQLANLSQTQRKKRKHWVHSLWQKNKKFGIFNVYRQEINLDDHKFKLFYRMKKETFSKLLKKLRPMLQKKDTNFRKCVSPAERLLITLRYFATGCNMKALSCYFLRGHTTIREIIATTSQVIWKVLQPTYLQTPTKKTWIESARRYWELWNLPNCVGSVDGKHIRIRHPLKSGSQFINYKGYFSIILMAVSDADGRFLTIDVGEYGRNSDGRALQESNFGKKLLDGTLDLPDPSPLPGQHTNFPFYFAADEAFPLKSNMMKPYPKRGLTNRKRIFNGRLSRGRKSVECSFGMMSSKFRILHPTIALKEDRVDIIIQAVCVLHNFIKSEEGVFSCPRGKKGNDSDIQVENEEPQHNPRLSNQRRATNPAIAIRQKLCDFFFTVDGALKDQKRFCI